MTANAELGGNFERTLEHIKASAVLRGNVLMAASTKLILQRYPDESQEAFELRVALSRRLVEGPCAAQSAAGK